MNSIQIINGINTDVGKTFISTYIINKKILNNKKINYIKPIISGFDENKIEESDTGIALKSLKKEVNMENAKKCTKYFLKHPTSPNIASKMEGVEIEYEKVLEFCFNAIERAISNQEDLIIETAGGLCTPITNSKTMLDLTKDINAKYKVHNVLVVSNYLGAISHTISACKLFNFDEIILNIQNQTEFDLEIKQTMEDFLHQKVVPLGGLEPPRA